MTVQEIEVPPIAPTPEPVEAHPSPAPKRASRFRPRVAAFGWALVGFAVLIALWQLAAWRVPDLPTPVATFAELRSLLARPFYDGGPNDKGIGLQLLTSLRRVATGFLLAAAIGIPLGLAIGTSRRAWQAVNPVVQMLRPVSPLAWYPIWLIVFKDAAQAAVWVIFITALWPIVINTAAGAASVPADHRNVAQVFRFGRVAYLRHVLIPDTLPSIVTGMRLSMGVAWMVIVAVEMMSGGVGIGSYVWTAYNALDLEKVVAAVILIGLVGVALDGLFMRLAKTVAIEEVKP
jgi:nitrate/nitrite transport system permease protein